MGFHVLQTRFVFRQLRHRLPRTAHRTGQFLLNRLQLCEPILTGQGIDSDVSVHDVNGGRRGESRQDGRRSASRRHQRLLSSLCAAQQQLVSDVRSPTTLSSVASPVSSASFDDPVPHCTVSFKPERVCVTARDRQATTQ